MLSISCIPSSFSWSFVHFPSILLYTSNLLSYVLDLDHPFHFIHTLHIIIPFACPPSHIPYSFNFYTHAHDHYLRHNTKTFIYSLEEHMPSLPPYTSLHTILLFSRILFHQIVFRFPILGMGHMDSFETWSSTLYLLVPYHLAPHILSVFLSSTDSHFFSSIYHALAPPCHWSQSILSHIHSYHIQSNSSTTSIKFICPLNSITFPFF